MSHLGTGPSAGAIWESKACVEPTVWIEWLLEVIREFSAHFLYASERGAELPTIIHKLAADPAGHTVLEKVISHFAKYRHSVLNGVPYDAQEHGKALSTIGMLSRAGSSTERGSALAVAIKESQEDMTKLLLDDYRDHISTFGFSASRAYAPATIVCELTEGDLLRLFDTFPRLAAEFLILLPLLRTNLVSPESKCDFLNDKHRRFVRPSTEHSPHVDVQQDHSFELWWEHFIDKEWDKAQVTKAAKETWLRLGLCFTCFISDDHRSMNRSIKKRKEDTAWGTRVVSERIPVIAGTYTTVNSSAFTAPKPVRAIEDKEKLLQRLSMTKSADETDTLITDDLSRELKDPHSDRYNRRGSMALVALKLHEHRDLFGNVYKEGEEDHEQLPFSTLLEKCCQHARVQKSSALFRSPTLQAIVQYKWQIGYRMYRTMVGFYFFYLVCLTMVTFNFERWTGNTDEKWHKSTPIAQTDDYGHYDKSGGDGWYDPDAWGNGTGKEYSGEVSGGWKILAWILFGYSFLYTMLLFRHEYVQLKKEKWEYWHSIWNWVDMLAATLAIITLVAMAVLYFVEEGQATPPPDEEVEEVGGEQGMSVQDWRDLLDIFQAHAMLFCYIKLLYFLRGLDFSAFFVKMLLEIASDMFAFLIILLVVTVAFLCTFYLMLRHDRSPPVYPEETMFGDPYNAFFGVWGMTFGEFPIAELSEAAHGVASVDFLLFLLAVPLVMLNALIAIMSNTYDRVKAEAEPTQLQDRAEVRDTQIQMKPLAALSLLPASQPAQ
jgi:hypothetical protein